ncbi:carboxypeptidase [Achlya hypogyna]|uniref:Carboxypeptidase n=1 Tax=Achlya hypogyna TaxID=1202772 RepID=A0A0A7CNA1_ACHHY|nr:secreted protein [Achlya hypogyna]OQR93015.1 carboxypeptidase [Achlya hypogyna]
MFLPVLWVVGHAIVCAAPSEDVAANEACHARTAGYLSRLVSGQLRASAYFDCFRPWPHMQAFLDALSHMHPSALTSVPVGSTTTGLPIVAYHVHAATAGKKALYVQATQHAREWIAGSSAVYLVAALLDAPGAVPFDVIVVPVVNVDGYEATWTTSRRYQRKNARAVDLNRNWPNPHWDSQGNSTPVTSDAFPGSSALSETETSSLHTWLQVQAPGLAAVVDLHSYAGQVLFPCADGHDKAPLQTQQLAMAMAQAMGADYGSEQMLRGLPLVGTFRDYAHRQLQTLSFTVELAGDDFVVPAARIRSHGEEIVRATFRLAQGLLTPPSST